MAADVKSILRRWEDLKTARMPHEQMWRDIDDYFTPRRSPIINRGPGEFRDRRVVDATGMISVNRLAAMTFGFLVSANMPFVRPDVGSGLIAAGRAADDIDAAGRDYQRDRVVMIAELAGVDARHMAEALLSGNEDHLYDRPAELPELD